MTYRGRPLYYYVGDRKPGQILCQNVREFGGLWLIVRPSGDSFAEASQRARDEPAPGYLLCRASASARLASASARLASATRSSRSGVDFVRCRARAA